MGMDMHWEYERQKEEEWRNIPKMKAEYEKRIKELEEENEHFRALLQLRPVSQGEDSRRSSG